MQEITEVLNNAKKLKDNEKFEESLLILENLYKKNSNEEVKKALIDTLFSCGAYMNDMYVVKYQKAAECFKRIIELEPTSYRAYYNLGIAYSNLGDYDSALDACNKALKIKPDYKHCYYNIGLIYELKEDFKSALEFYEKALDIDPNFTYGIQAVNYIRELIDSQRREKVE